MSYKPTVTALQGDEIQVTDEMTARAVWLLKKYTSLTFLRRMYALYANFVAGYEEHARRKTDNNQFYRENLASLFTYQGELEKGLQFIEKGHKSGYAHVAAGLWFSDFLSGRRFDNGLGHEEIGFRWNAPAVGLYAWADRAIRLGTKAELTLKVEWAYPRIFDETFEPLGLPPLMPPAPRATGPIVRLGEEVPTSGIWMPVEARSATPAYLVAGGPARAQVHHRQVRDDGPRRRNAWIG